MFSSLTGQHEFSASAGNYTGQSKQVDVEADWTTQTAFQVGAGQLSVSPATTEANLRMPAGKATKSITVKNTGTAPVEVEFGERDGDFVLARANGEQLSKSEVLGSSGAPLQRIQAETSFASKLTGKAPVPAKPTTAPNADPWTDIADYPAAVMDNRVVSLDGKVYSLGGSSGSASTAKNYVYDPIAQSWSPIADLPGARNALSAGVIDGKIVATGGWAPNPAPETWVYDPGANTWTAKANNPVPRSAAGQAVVDGKLYAIGGCTTSACTPMSNSAVRYDLATNTWETLPNYPVSVAFASCGGIEGVVYCTGGNNGSAAVKSSYKFDPGNNTWTAIADAPQDSWASSFAVANGKLLVVGGVLAGTITNGGFSYDPASNAWSALPNANAARYRGGAACGFYKIGGSITNFSAAPDSEALPGLEECAEAAADVSWMSLDKTSATLAPGAQTTVKVTMTANVDQPGKYTGSVAIKENTPYSVDPIGLTMNALPPTTWGKLLGTVTGTSCQGDSAPIAGATVQVDSWASSFTFTTDTAGQYAYWMDRRNNPLTMIVAKDGWKPQTRQSRISVTDPAVEDFDLKPTRC